jgi:hypothetical protein
MTADPSTPAVARLTPPGPRDPALAQGKAAENAWNRRDKVVFVTELSDELNNQVVRSTPAGLTILMLPNRVADGEKLAALTDADCTLSFGSTFSEHLVRSARTLRFIREAFTTKPASLRDV